MERWEKIVLGIMAVMVVWAGIPVLSYRALGRSQVVERPLKQFVVGDKASISGSFFLGCGSISGTEQKQYFFYFKVGDNKFRPASVSLTKAIIVEDGFNKAVFRGEYGNIIDQGDVSGVREVEFHIPLNSILENYNPNFSSK